MLNITFFLIALGDSEAEKRIADSMIQSRRFSRWYERLPPAERES